MKLGFIGKGISGPELWLMNPDPPHQTPLKATNQAVKGLEGQHKQPLPALVQQTLKTNHASVQKNCNNHQSVKKSDRNQTKIGSLDHTPAPAFIFHCSLCLDTLAFQPSQGRLMTVS